MKKIKKMITILLLLVFILSACAPAASQPAENQPEANQQEEDQSTNSTESDMEAEESSTDSMPVGVIIVASKDFTEQFILGQITVIALTEAGYVVEDETNLGGTAVAREALMNGDVDVYWEYTGTAWLAHLGHEDVITDPEEAYDKVKTEDAENSLVWLDYAPFNNTYTLMMQQTTGEELGIKSISDLAAYINGGGDASLCTNQEFYARPDGFKGLEELYGFAFSEDQVNMMDSGLTYKALQDGQCTTAMGFATDGRIPAFGFFNLVDDLNYFPVYNPAPVIRQEVLDMNPGIADVLNPISASLTTDVMMNLNKRVDIDAEEPDAVACDFLMSEGFVETCP